jgi:hypothetical protein
MAHKRNAISGQFSARLIEMQESPSYRVMSLSAHRVLSRIEIELGHHAGKDNGKLPVTYEQFVEYGMHRHAVAPAIRELVALGFIEVTEHGRSGEGFARSPNKFRLTYKHGGNDRADGTHEWRRIKTMKDAEAVADAARETPVKIKSPVPVYGHAQWRKPSLAGNLPVAETGTQASAETITTSISRDQGSRLEDLDLLPPAPPCRLRLAA